MVNGRHPAHFVGRVSPHAILFCMLCVYTKIGEHNFKSYMYSKRSFSFCKMWLKGCALAFSSVDKTHAKPMGKMRNKESETLYPVSTVLCVSQCPGPIIHRSFPTFLYIEWKTNKKPKAAGLLGASVWKRCFFLKPHFIQCPQVSSLDHTLSFRLNAPLPPLLFSTSTRIKHS